MWYIIVPLPYKGLSVVYMSYFRKPETLLCSMWPIYAKNYPSARYTVSANVCIQNAMRFP
jgi:hypothetical protein